jgi:lysophospholipid acyltransferase (LPLAT)-like uncharacterized protein
MAATAVKRSSEVVVPHKPKWHQRALARVIFALIKVVSVTLRYRTEIRGADGGAKTDGPIIFGIWHNRLALSMSAYARWPNRAARLAVMVSASKDGGFLSGVLECFGVQPVRGSTSRRGAQALRELTTWSRRGYDLGITPDGPRGPCYTVQDGIVALAQLTERPLVPVTCNVRWKIRVKSWDRFQIPLPFSRCEVIFGAPIRVPRETSAPDREQFRLRLENAMKEITKD